MPLATERRSVLRLTAVPVLPLAPSIIVPVTLTWGGRLVIALWSVVNGMLFVLEVVSR